MDEKVEKALSPNIVLHLGTTSSSSEANWSDRDGLYSRSMSTMQLGPCRWRALYTCRRTLNSIPWRIIKNSTISALSNECWISALQNWIITLIVYYYYWIQRPWDVAQFPLPQVLVKWFSPWLGEGSNWRASKINKILARFKKLWQQNFHVGHGRKLIFMTGYI